jgi:hypothetical protein
MIEVELSERATVDVDVCRLCHFVWFDMREVETLNPRPLPAAAPEMPRAAREAIGAVVGFVAWLLWRKTNRATEVSRL